MCLTQRARNPNASNFSILSLVIILVFGSLIIVINLALEPPVGWVQKLMRKGLYQRVE